MFLISRWWSCDWTPGSLDIRTAFFGNATLRVLSCGWVHKKEALRVPTRNSHKQFASVSDARIRNAVTNLENGTLSTCPTAEEERYSWPYIGESRKGDPECAPILCLGRFQPRDTAGGGRTGKSGWRAWPQSPAEGTVAPRGGNFSISCQVNGVDPQFLLSHGRKCLSLPGSSLMGAAFFSS